MIFINVIKDRIRFAYDDNKFYNSHTVINCIKWNLLTKVNHITVKRNVTRTKIELSSQYNYLFLLGILNSRLINWYFLNFLSESLHFYPDDAKELPIPKIPESAQQPFITRVDKILSAKQKDPDADTSELEKEIDRMVYKLYDLTPEEIAIVEGRK